MRGNVQELSFRSFDFNTLLKNHIEPHFEAVQNISLRASKEHSLAKALAKMRLDWEPMSFNIIPYKDSGTFILGGVEEVQNLLDDQLVRIQSMRASPFIKYLEGEANAWHELITTLQDMLDNWLTCQATWQYLEPIFSSPDIMKQMPEEGDKFQQVDTQWRDLMAATAENHGCLAVARDRERLDVLRENNTLLEAIQKGLAAYLEVKRIAFPRCAALYRPF
jgi:dynein heavy chain, axonemal